MPPVILKPPTHHKSNQLPSSLKWNRNLTTKYNRKSLCQQKSSKPGIVWSGTVCLLSATNQGAHYTHNILTFWIFKTGLNSIMYEELWIIILFAIINYLHHAFVVVCWLFFISFFSKKSFRNTILVSNRLDLDQNQHFVCPDLGPNCFQRLSADDKSHN